MHSCGPWLARTPGPSSLWCNRPSKNLGLGSLGFRAWGFGSLGSLGSLGSVGSLGSLGRLGV